ncbi:MAG: leucyl aminopeptidase [Elusimicrobia bacterium]|nr:leucyl aminopeptidase [Elusimicrobiota bacterium]MBD3411756.1 leucyl aminopeptidase [Elusimicrobiota bacterium]
MQINCKAFDKNIQKQRIVGVYAYEDNTFPTGFTGAAGKTIIEQAKKLGFNGRVNQVMIVSPHHAEVPETVIIAGLGKKKDCSYEDMRIATAGIIQQAEKIKQNEIDLVLPSKKDVKLDFKKMILAVAETIWLRTYRFDKYQKSDDDKPKPLQAVTFYCADAKTVQLIKPIAEQAGIIARGVYLVRDLVNEPASGKTPAELASQAKKLATQGRITVKVFEKQELKKMGFGGLLGVNRGSHLPPVFIHLTYKPVKQSRKTIVVVGKGITFDSGGINLKPSRELETMKMDMAGAATVLGLFKILRSLDLPLTVHGLVPATENLPGGGAMKPSDIITAHNGKTIEVVNTDAEGRLILADALSYGAKLKPDIMIDMATLTGAMVVAGGMLLTGILGTAAKQIEQIKNLGEEFNEHFMVFPLLKEYEKRIKSKIADIRNTSIGKGAGVITAALFLKHFVGEIPWIHLDIAGSAWTDEELPYCPPNGTGVPLRTLTSWLTHL